MKKLYECERCHHSVSKTFIDHLTLCETGKKVCLLCSKTRPHEILEMFREHIDYINNAFSHDNADEMENLDPLKAYIDGVISTLTTIIDNNLNLLIDMIVEMEKTSD